MQDGQKLMGQITGAINLELKELDVIKNMSQEDKDALIGGLGNALQASMPDIITFNPDQKIDDQIDKVLGNAAANPHGMYLAAKGRGGRMTLTNVASEFINLALDVKAEKKSWRTQLRF